MYQVDAYELDSPPRVVACSACLHEWAATEDSLIWGDEAALQALNVSLNDHPYTAGSTRSTQNASGNSSPSYAPHSSSDSSDDSQSDSDPPPPPKSPGFSKTASANRKISDSDSNKYNSERNQKRTHDSSESSKVSPTEPPKVHQKDTDHPEVRPQHNSDQSVSGTGSDLDTDEAAKDNTPPQSSDAEKRRRSGKYVKEKNSVSIFVGNLSFRATEEDLYRAFSGYGLVLKCQVPLDSCGASKGFGFVVMRDRTNGLKAIEALHGASILGRDISLTEAYDRPKSKRSRGVSSSPDAKRRTRSEDHLDEDQGSFGRSAKDSGSEEHSQKGLEHPKAHRQDENRKGSAD